ncbi:hypothetical protein CK203_088907 [Vitis vinifera]|uniref:Uncharacterized protein n=1 Tax=Vitis vinifera TaxID=29760 RepID=A0A438D0N7_VITVI|nr:hypothetical protein CK203_088907 [Vitis vinifera]
MIRNQSFEVERKAFQVKFEGFNGGTWISITERSRGFVVSLGFGEEESGWLLEHLKKDVDLEASRGRRLFQSKTCLFKLKELEGEAKKPQVSKGMYRAIARRVGMKGMVSVTPISAYKGCFFVDSARRAQWIQDQGSLTTREEVIALRRWLPKENSVVNGKFRRGWLELGGLPFHLWDEAQLRYILQKWGKVTKVARESLKLVD